MKKKILLVVFILIGCLSLILTYKFKQNNLSKNKPIKEEKLSIMIKEAGATDYTKSSSKDIPTGSYTLNEEKTHCENNGQVTNYDASTGTVSFSFIGSDKCYLYFDYKSSKSFSDVIIANSNLVSDDDSSIYEIANENGLRYEGKNPDNYICLDNKKGEYCLADPTSEDCELEKIHDPCLNEKLLFRIIGLFDEEYSTDGTNSSGNTKLLKIIDTNTYENNGQYKHYWNQTQTTGKNLNDWSVATLKDELNNDYLNSLLSQDDVNSKLSSSIALAKWHLGGAGPENYDTILADGLYEVERNVNAIVSGNPPYLFAKVGLMYASDNVYATNGGDTTSKEECRNNPYGDTTIPLPDDCQDNNWISVTSYSYNSSSDYEWFIMPSTLAGNFVVSFNNSYIDFLLMHANSDMAYARPVLYLNSNVTEISRGNGTKGSPYRIEVN